MKNFIFITVFAVCGYMGSAQTFVETTPSNRNVIIEQFNYENLGITRTDTMINRLILQNPNRIWGITAHDWIYSYDVLRDLTCEDGVAFVDYFKPWNYPTVNTPRGMVNRGSMQNIEDIQNSVSAVLSQPSCLNVAAQGTIDWNLRQLTLTVEVYYTGNSNVSENYVTVALLQNNLEGEESGAKWANPAQTLPNGNYNHLRVLRDIISPTWGDTIATTMQGSFFTKTYIYIIPDTIASQLPNISKEQCELPEVLLEDLEVIVFVSESKENIISGAKAEITHENVPEINLRTKLENIDETSTWCGDEFSIYITLKNEGSDTIHSIGYNLLKDNQPLLQNQVWNSRPIYPFTTDTITINDIPMVGGIESLISIEITQVNEIDTLIRVENLLTHHLVEDARGAMKLIIAHDQWGKGCIFILYDNDNEILLTNLYNRWSDLSSPGIKEYSYDFLPKTTGCYYFFIWNNLNKGYGEGYFKLLASDGTVLMHHDGKNSANLCYFINVTEPVGIVKTHCNASLRVYPNPAKGQLTIDCRDVINHVSTVEIYNVVGQLMQSAPMTSPNPSKTSAPLSFQGGEYFPPSGELKGAFCINFCPTTL